MSDRTPTKTILILAANPTDTQSLRLVQEAREIYESLKFATKGYQFAVRTEWGIRPEDIQRTVLEAAPQIIHFCGHGDGVRGLVVENEVGTKQFVSTQALANFLKLFRGQIECVLLNACYSEVQADAISRHIPYVIGMSQEVGDRAAIKFAVGFYGALGSGRSYEEAFEFGCNAIELQGIPEDLTPRIKKPKTGTSTPHPRVPSYSPPPQQSPLPRASSQSAKPKQYRESHTRLQKTVTSLNTSSAVLKLDKKIWIFLLFIVAVWVWIGYRLDTPDMDAPGDEFLGFLGFGALGGLASGFLGAIAQRQIVPNYRLEKLFLQCIIGAVLGAPGWSIFAHLSSGWLSGSGWLIGLIAGLVVAGLVLWKICRDRATLR